MNVTTGEGGAMFFFMNNINGVPYSAGNGTSCPDGYFVRTGAPLRAARAGSVSKPVPYGSWDDIGVSGE